MKKYREYREIIKVVSVVQNGEKSTKCIPLKAPYSSKIDILLSKKSLINWYMVLMQSYIVAPDSL